MKKQSTTTTTSNASGLNLKAKVKAGTSPKQKAAKAKKKASKPSTTTKREAKAKATTTTKREAKAKATTKRTAADQRLGVWSIEVGGEVYEVPTCPSSAHRTFRPEITMKAAQKYATANTLGEAMHNLLDGTAGKATVSDAVLTAYVHNPEHASQPTYFYAAKRDWAAK